MFIVPHLAQHRVPVITRPLTRSRGIVARPRAPDERNAAVLLGQRVLEVRVRVGGAVGGDDVLCLQPLVGREALVVFDCGFEEIDDFLVFAVERAVAGHVEGAVARGVLAEFVAPEAGVVLVLWEFSVGESERVLGADADLGDPVVVHVFQEVVAAKWLEEGADVGARVGGHGGAVLEAVGGIGGGDGVVLSSQIAVLCVRAIAEIGPTGEV